MDHERAKNKAMIEALLFVSSEPLIPSEIKKVAEIAESEIIKLLDEISDEYAERAGGISIARVAGGYQMITNPAHNELIKRLKGKVKSQKLSMAALETLAIIAYKQPITKAEIEDLRGVSSDGIVKSLMDKLLVKIIGKKESPGRPLLYSTSREFLHYFGLNDLTELPTLKDLDKDEAA